MTEHAHTLSGIALALLLSGCGPGTETSETSDAAVARANAIPTLLEAGDAEARISVVPTLALGEAIAARYGVERAPGRALVLVELREDTGSRRADITGRVRDLRGTPQQLVFREVRTDDLIDYVAIARASAPDTLRFELDILFEDAARARLTFNRDLAR